MQYEDQKAGPVVSALVLVAAAVFTANVYMFFAADRDIVVYEQAEADYNQAASIFLGLKEAQVETASTTEEVAEDVQVEEVELVN